MLWDGEQYGTGVPDVDQHHRELFDHLNQLLEDLRDQEGRGVLAGMLEFLEDYCDRHFPVEEAAMARANAPTKEENMAAHKQFREWLAGFKDRFDREETTQEENRAFVYANVDWWRDHVQGVDSSLRLKSRKTLHSSKREPN
ncbi:MAG: hypothetical protein GY851_05850 [bacterium]|nr:hypothetical protein [bacterium]